MKRLALTVAVTLAMAPGCTTEEDPSNGDARSGAIPKIRGGTLVDTDFWGLPWIGATATGNGFCSGTVLSDRWVLTAEHCDLSAYLRGTTVRMKEGNREIAVTRSHVMRGTDAGLMRLATPARGQFVHHNGLYRGRTEDLRNRTLKCFGWGPTSNGGPDSALRTIDLTVTDVDPDGRIFRTGPGIIHGDSGGPCFVEEGGQLYIAGITATSSDKDSTFQAASAFRDWADQVMSSDVGPTEVVLSTGYGFTGETTILDPGAYRRPADLFAANDEISSLRVGSMVDLEAFRDDDFFGRELFVAGFWLADLGSFGMDQAISSARVSPVPGCRLPGPNEITVYEDSNFRGLCDTLKASSIDDLAPLRVGYGISSVHVGTDVRVTLYGQTGFSGSDAIALTNDTADLTALGWNDHARALRVNARSCFAPGADEVVVYEDVDFLGACHLAPVDRMAALTTVFAPGASSVQIGPNARLALYSDDGAQLNLNVDHPYLPALGWNDRATRMWGRRSRGCAAPLDDEVVLWEDQNFTGRCLTLGIGAFDRYSDFDLGVDRLTSLQVGAGVKATLFENQGFSGPNQVSVFFDNANLSGVQRGPNLGDNWNDVTSSIIVSTR